MHCLSILLVGFLIALVVSVPLASHPDSSSLAKRDVNLAEYLPLALPPITILLAGAVSLLVNLALGKYLINHTFDKVMEWEERKVALAMDREEARTGGDGKGPWE